MKTISMILGVLMGFNLWAQASGDPDTNFGLTGYLSHACNLGSTPPLGEGDEWIKAVYVYTDSSLLVAGNAYHTNEQDIDMVVMKITSGGMLDTNFGGNGCAVVGFDLGGDNQDYLNDILIDSNGDIYLIGEAGYASNDTDFAIARLTSQGVLDTTFSDDGKQLVWFDHGGDNRDSANSAVIFGNSLFVVGSAEQSTGNDFAWVKISSDGTIESKLTYDLAHTAVSNDQALKVFMANATATMWVMGTAADTDNSESPAIIRVDYNGQLDTGFSSDGKYVYPDSRTGSYINDVSAKSSNGFTHPAADEFVFVGRDTHPGTNDKIDCSVVYVNAVQLDGNDNPVVDTFNFNMDPNPTLFDFNSACRGAKLTDEGELILTGLLHSDDFSGLAMGLMRFSHFSVSNGSSSYAIDNGFGFSGRRGYSLSTHYSSTADVPYSIATDVHDRIIMAGYATINGVNKPAVVRVIQDGGENPTVTITAPTTNQFFDNDPITFAATASDPEDGDISGLIQWHSNVDGNLHSGAGFTDTLTAGIHLITASVTDSDGQTDSASIGIEVLDSPTPPSLANIQPLNNSSYVEGTTVTFSAVAIDDEDGNITANITWHSHIDGALGTGGQVQTNSMSVGEHVITIQIIDSDGQFDDEQLTIFITEDDVIFKNGFEPPQP